MLLPIRPHYLFGQVPKENQIVSLPIPSTRNSGSPTLLETFILLAAGRIVNPKRIFEIGTFRGLTTRILAMNFPNADLYTLDLDPDLAAETLSPHGYVKQLKGHSMQFDFSPYYGTCQLVFIDGGHDYATVLRDSATALKLIDPAAPSAIVWHDCGHPQCPGVADALQESELPIFHVDESQMAVWFSANDR
jgi:hypothetical protein